MATKPPTSMEDFAGNFVIGNFFCTGAMSLINSSSNMTAAKTHSDRLERSFSVKFFPQLWILCHREDSTNVWSRVVPLGHV